MRKMANRAQNHAHASISSWAMALACESQFSTLLPWYLDASFHKQAANSIVVKEETLLYQLQSFWNGFYKSK